MNFFNKKPTQANRPDVGRATRDGSASNFPSAVASTAAPDPVTPVAAIREQLAGAPLRAILVEFHGPIEGDRLFAAAVHSREKAERSAHLDAELADERLAFEEETTAAEEIAEDLRIAAARAKDAFDEALRQWQAQCFRIDQLFVAHQDRVANIRERIQGARPLEALLPVWAAATSQWSRPSWYQPALGPPAEQELLRGREQRGPNQG
jgi:hypothetical protein